ncbi:Protein argonaute, N-terminal [Sesbania bispinosa]|nr:Protein argonaute, N-terminal [Sesbania bispinosa]
MQALTLVYRRRSGSGGRGQDVILQLEWRRQRPSGSPSPNPPEPANEAREEEMLLQPEWRRSKPSSSVWEPEWRRSRPTAYPWNQNYGVRKQGGSSSGDYAVPKLERLQISKELATSSCTLQEKDKISPIRRPDNGGTLAILTNRLLVNHFPVNFNPESIILHYNVAVKPKVSSKPGQLQKLSKSDMSMIREKLVSDDPEILPLEMTAHDGARNIYSAVQLPEETFTEEISEGEDEKAMSYIVSITLVNKLRLHKLMDYLCGNTLSTPRDILQGMDVVVKENPARLTTLLSHKSSFGNEGSLGGFSIV